MRKVEPVFSDSRGEIFDILTKHHIDAVTIIHTKQGAIRGNHFHKETYQWLYIISGKVRSVSKLANGEKIEEVAEEGDLIIHIPFQQHAFEALEDTKWLVLTQGPRSGQDYESDTFRLDQPLL